MLSVSRLESRRICSSVSGSRPCASSMISSTRLPAACFSTQEMVQRLDEFARRMAGGCFGAPGASRRAFSTPSSTRIDSSSSCAESFGIEEERDLDFAAEAPQQRAAQRRLAGADLAGDGDETLALLDAVEQMRERFAMRLRQIEEARIGAQGKGLFAEPEERGIHAPTCWIAKAITRLGQWEPPHWPLCNRQPAHPTWRSASIGARRWRSSPSERRRAESSTDCFQPRTATRVALTLAAHRRCAGRPHGRRRDDAGAARCPAGWCR